MTTERILVTGATGFIGGHLTRRLHDDGDHVIALERTPSKGDDLRQAGITVVRGDITDHKRMTEVLQDTRPDLVMHIAAWLSGAPLENYYLVNVMATEHLARASAAAGARRFVYTSSIMAYAFPGDDDIDESRPLEVYGDPYGDSKIRSERALWAISEETGLEVAVVRPGMVYGPGSRQWTLTPNLWAKRGTSPLVNEGRGTAYPIFVDNLVEMLVLCATHPDAAGEAFNGVDDGPVTFADFFGAYMAMLPTTRALRIPGWLLDAAASTANLFVRRYNYRSLAAQLTSAGRILNDKAKTVLGWEQHIGFDEAMQRTEAWLRENGYL